MDFRPYLKFQLNRNIREYAIRDARLPQQIDNSTK
jgi:hypothetical protein